MLEQPDVQDDRISACLRDHYGLGIVEVTFLPLGADANTAVYRVTAEDQTPYFLKLRSGVFDQTAVRLPHFLHQQGIPQIIDPIATRSGRLWGTLDAYTVILYPFIEGHNGFHVPMSERQWIEFGAALRRIHTVIAPPALTGQIQRETYAPQWREIVREFQAQVERETFADPISAELAALLKSKRAVIDDLVERSERLAAILQSRPSSDSVICHTDIHAGNLLITASGDFYIVDWDAPLLALKERDLMFIGGGVGRLDTPDEQALFYRGYGQTDIDPAALAYYRYERIVEDFAAYCDEIFLSGRGDQDRAEGLRRVRSQFLPDAVIDVAYRTDRTR
ncbi:MAG TPA: phosphotransferase [Phototrophicaceae bacterium]|nr:phosphotransferase [Phototrophicaceae bacterium]